MKTFRQRALALVLAIVAILGLGVIAAPPASAGNGCGWVRVYSSSVQGTQVSLDYLGRSGNSWLGAGQIRGGCGYDIDAVYVPGNRLSTVDHSAGYSQTFNRRGLGGFWLKVNDLGAHIWIRY